MDFLASFPMEIQLLCAAGMGIVMGMIFCWFGEILSPDDLV